MDGSDFGVDGIYTGDSYAGDGGEEHLNGAVGAHGGAGDLVAPEVDPLAQVPGDSVESNLWLYADGTIWDMGPAEVDADGDGRADSLTSAGGGTLTVYTDSDHDGRIDRVAQIDGSGEYVVVGLDAATGTWEPGAFGRLD